MRWVGFGLLRLCWSFYITSFYYYYYYYYYSWELLFLPSREDLGRVEIPPPTWVLLLGI